MHWVKNPSSIDLDLLFQPRIPDSCIWDPEIVASLFKTASGKKARDTYFSRSGDLKKRGHLEASHLCDPQSISHCEHSVANAFPFGQIEARRADPLIFQSGPLTLLHSFSLLQK